MVSSNRFIEVLHEQQAGKTISLPKISRDQYCHMTLQILKIQQQQVVIDRAEASIAEDAQNPLVESEVDYFTENERRMQRAVDQRAELASLRKSYLQADRPDLASAIDERIDELNELDEPREATVCENVGRFVADSDEADVTEEEDLTMVSSKTRERMSSLQLGQHPHAKARSQQSQKK